MANKQTHSHTERTVIIRYPPNGPPITYEYQSTPPRSDGTAWGCLVWFLMVVVPAMLGAGLAALFPNTLFGYLAMQVGGTLAFIAFWGFIVIGVWQNLTSKAP
jgi:hypothetical protein